MGRSQMQGTPWHYEYLHNKKSKRNSINCIYNNGYKCIYAISQYHGKQCVGARNCSDFERCSVPRPELYKTRTPQTAVKNNKRKNVSDRNNYNPKITVEKGNTVVVSVVETGERIDIHVTDVKNPFYMKKINEIVLIKCEQYKIVEIKKNRKG